MMYMRLSTLVAVLALASCGQINEPVIVPDGTKDAEAGQTVNGRIEIGDDVTVTSGQFRTVNGSVRIGSRTEIRGVATVNGSVRVGDDTTTGEVGTINGSVIFGDRATVQGDIVAVNGGILLGAGSTVSGSITTVNGRIELVGVTVEGDVENINEGMELTGATHIKGTLAVRESQGIELSRRVPVILIGPEVRVDGQLVFEREVELRIHRGAQLGEIVGAEPQWLEIEGETVVETEPEDT